MTRIDRTTVEACMAAARKAWPPAHTYASENADLYRAQDHVRDTIIAALAALPSSGGWQDIGTAVESETAARETVAFDAIEASEHHILFYKLPQELCESDIDPLMWPVVRTINASGWVWSAECCQGHPDFRSGDAGWDHNVRPFIRLVTRSQNLGSMLGALALAMRLPNVIDGDPQALRIDATCSFQTFIWPHRMGPWEQVNIYIDAHNVLGRDQGIEALQNFANSLLPAPPEPLRVGGK